MSTRTVVSYDDITLPYDPIDADASVGQPSPRAEQPPAKKRKKNNQKGKNRANPSRVAAFAQRNKFTNGSAHISSKPSQPQEEEEYEDGMHDQDGYYEEEESRELTHEEIWDDSALVYAWEAAMEEYEAFHGPESDWKKEPVKKSPLWYNVPPDQLKKSSDITNSKALPTASPSVGVEANNTIDEEGESDSKPIDFDTFVPTHDPSLHPSDVPVDPAVAQASQINYVPDSSAVGMVVSQDEAFQRATSAMYWAGYWTAMYHAQRQLSQSQQIPTEQTAAASEEDAEEAEIPQNDDIEVDNDSELVSTQR